MPLAKKDRRIVENLLSRFFEAGPSIDIAARGESTAAPPVAEGLHDGRGAENVSQMKQEPLMSAEQTHEENTARKEDEPLLPAAVPFWMRVTVQPDGSELPQEPGPGTAEGHEGAPDGTAEDDETYAFLLQAIQGTEFAKLLGGMPPPNGSPLPQALSAAEPEAVTAAPDLNSTVVSPGNEAPAAEAAPPVTAQVAATEETAEHAEAAAAPIETVEDAHEGAGEIATPVGGEAAQEEVTADSAATATECAVPEPPVAFVAAAAAPEAEPAVMETVAPEPGAITKDAPGPDEAPPETADATGNAAEMEVAAPAEEIAPEEAATAAATESATAEAGVEPAVAETPAPAATQAEPVATPALGPPEGGEESEPSAAPFQPSAETQSSQDVEEAAPTDAAAVQESMTASAAEIAAPGPAVEEPAASPAPGVSEPRKPDAPGVTQPKRRGEGLNGRRRRKGHRGGKGRYAAPRGRYVSTRPPSEVRIADEGAESTPQGPEPETASTAPPQSVSEVLTARRESIPQPQSAAPEPPRPSSALRIFEAPMLPEMPPPALEVATGKHEAAETQEPAELVPVDASGEQKAADTPESGEPVAIDASGEQNAVETAESAELVPIDAASPATETSAETAKDVSLELPAPAMQAAAATECEPVESPAAAESNGTEEVLPPAEPVPESAATASSPDSLAREKNGTAKGANSGRPGNGLGRVTFRQTGEYLDRAEMHLETWFLKWFDPPDPRRRNARVPAPPLAAYHWTMDVPQGLKIADISPGGMYLVTEERWTEGVIVSLTLQRTDMEKGAPDSWIAVDFVVTRWGQDGIGGEFIPRRPGLTDAVAGRASNCADKKTLERFVSQLATPAHQ